MSRCMITMMRMMKRCVMGSIKKNKDILVLREPSPLLQRKDFSPMLDGPCTRIDSMESAET